MYKLKGLESAQDSSTPCSQHKGDFFTSEGQRQGIGKGEGRKGARELEGGRDIGPGGIKDYSG